MTKIKSIIIFILSILLAFETGGLFIAAGFVAMTEDEKKRNELSLVVRTIVTIVKKIEPAMALSFYIFPYGGYQKPCYFGI
jgi:hypothetical protein